MSFLCRTWILSTSHQQTVIYECPIPPKTKCVGICYEINEFTLCGRHYKQANKNGLIKLSIMRHPHAVRKSNEGYQSAESAEINADNKDITHTQRVHASTGNQLQLTKNQCHFQRVHLSSFCLGGIQGLRVRGAGPGSWVLGQLSCWASQRDLSRRQSNQVFPRSRALSLVAHWAKFMHQRGKLFCQLFLFPVNGYWYFIAKY